MAEYHASDGSIETTKLVVSDALKKGPDLGQFLRGGPFASCAQIYRNLSSKFDFDAAFFLSLKQETLKKLSEGKGTQSNKPSYSRPRNFDQPRFPRGFCFAFQRVGICNHRSCTFRYECSDCHSRDHGADECRKKKSENSDSKQSDSDKKPRARLPFNPNRS